MIRHTTATTRGTRLGDPLDDINIFFAASQTPILLRIEACLQDRDALYPVRIPTSPVHFAPGDCAPTGLSDSTLDDDVALLTVIPRSVGPGDGWIQGIITEGDQ